MWKWEAENAKAVIVIIHGAQEHHGRYRWLIEMWRSHHFHVIAGDLPGHGLTSRRNRGHIDSFDEFIEAVESWVTEAEKYGLPIILLGHSMGGLTAIRYLEEKRPPVQMVILSSPCLGLIHTPSKGLEILSTLLNHLAPRMRVNSGLTVQMATRNKEVQELDVNDTLYVTKLSVRWYRELVRAIEQAFQMKNRLPDLPYLVMQGGDDLIVDPRAVNRFFDEMPVKEKAYKEWEQLYHEIFNEPEREDVFGYALHFVQAQLELLEKRVES